jgi:hypothetical protein
MVEHAQDVDLPFERLCASLVFQGPTLLDGLDREHLAVPLSDRSVDLLLSGLDTFAKLPLPNNLCRL